MKRMVNICMSGGRTSAYLVEMVLRLQKQGYFPDVTFIITFANTGREHEKTLEFVNKCSNRWYDLYCVKVVWLEAVVYHGLRYPCSHHITDFKNASRKGEPFEEVVKKYGLPNGNFLHCTRELKENPILSFMEMMGGKVGYTKNKNFIPATYETWIGIREDEPRRLGGNRLGKQTKVFPLAEPLNDEIDLSCDKQDVLEFWSEMPFDLGLPEHQGNCIDCHKKSDKKLALVYQETPSAFDFTKHLDDLYSGVKSQKLEDGTTKNRKRFRGYRNTKELIKSFKLGKEVAHERNGCETSCEPFMNDNEPEQLDFISDPKTWSELDAMGEEEQMV